jgi:hypothetical protein
MQDVKVEVQRWFTKSGDERYRAAISNSPISIRTPHVNSTIVRDRMGNSERSKPRLSFHDPSSSDEALTGGGVSDQSWLPPKRSEIVAHRTKLQVLGLHFRYQLCTYEFPQPARSNNAAQHLHNLAIRFFSEILPKAPAPGDQPIRVARSGVNLAIVS